jgi:NitT/TauT family transport system ATP-binding protein
MTDTLPVIRVEDLSKTFTMNGGGTLRVLDNVNFDVQQGECVCLIGHSGCGKTTLLRAVCGFEPPDSGSVLVDGAVHDKPDKDVLMLFQDFNQLFPWKTVLQNVMYPLLATKFITNKTDAKSRAMKRIADVGLSGFDNSYPHQLSGGMKQRVAVARALALQPRVLLMDEPFAALDNITRRTLQTLTTRVCEKYGVSMLLVTHSVEEAVIMSDRIVMMKPRPGRIGQIFNNPGRGNQSEVERAQLVEQILQALGDEK